MKKNIKYIFIVLLIFIIVFAVKNYVKSNSKNSLQVLSPSSLTEIYSNEKYNFSFKYPSGYKVTMFPDPQDDAADIILVQQDTVSGESSSGLDSSGFQLRVSPIDEDINFLSVERIKKDLPDFVIKDPQEVILGDEARAGKGVAFKSDSQDFGGESREVWFIFNKNLYQIRTYLTYDNLVQAVLSSWEFR